MTDSGTTPLCNWPPFDLAFSSYSLSFSLYYVCMYVGETFSNQLQAVFTLAIGLIIGFSASWKISLVVIATFPINVRVSVRALLCPDLPFDWLAFYRTASVYLSLNLKQPRVNVFILSLTTYSIHLPQICSIYSQPYTLWYRLQQALCVWRRGQGNTLKAMTRSC